MPRITQGKTQLPYYQYIDGALVGSGLADARDFYFSRADVKHNPKDPLGWRKPSSYDCYVHSIVYPTGRWINRVYGDHRVREGVMQIYADSRFPAPAMDAGLRQKAEVGALLKLKDQSVNLAQAFAERGQVANMFASNMAKLTKYARQLRRGNLKNAAGALGVKPPRRWPQTMGARQMTDSAIAGRHLEIQYGWLPLLSDIYGSVEQLEKDYPWGAYTVSVRKRERKLWDVAWNGEYGGGFCPFKVFAHNHIECMVRLDYTPDNLELATFASLGVTNPAALAWELVPFSFVADWALPVGDWLSSLDAAFGYTFKGGTRTEFRKTGCVISQGDLGTTLGPNLGWSVFSRNGTYRQLRIDRYVYPSSPIPTLPRFKNPWSYGHAANAAALAVQAFRGKKR